MTSRVELACNGNVEGAVRMSNLDALKASLRLEDKRLSVFENELKGTLTTFNAVFLEHPKETHPDSVADVQQSHPLTASRDQKASALSQMEDKMSCNTRSQMPLDAVSENTISVRAIPKNTRIFDFEEIQGSDLLQLDEDPDDPIDPPMDDIDGMAEWRIFIENKVMPCSAELGSAGA